MLGFAWTDARQPYYDLTPGSSDLTLNAGHFKGVYSKMGQASSPPDVIAFRMEMIRGARSWLQETYRTWVSKNVRSERCEIGGTFN
jgi:hypothetical protein